MFLSLSHLQLDVYRISKAFVLDCYRLTKFFPQEERFGMISQIRRAGLSVHLNIAEGCSRKSLNERKRFYEVARGSLIEIDAALEIAVELGYITSESVQDFGNLLVRIFKMISKLIAYNTES